MSNRTKEIALEILSQLGGNMQDVVVKSLENIYCDQLRDAFEVETNLLTSLAPRDSNVRIKGGLFGRVSY